MRLARNAGLLAMAGLLGGCLVDLQGGMPRIQFKNSSAFRVTSTGIGDPDDPTWSHELEPVLKPGKSSEVIDLPVAGALDLWVRLSDSTSSWDTVLVRRIDLDLGDFELLPVSGQAPSELSTFP